MQSLDIISVNLWQFLISVCNLLLLFLILKKFLYQPVKKAMAKREADIREQYDLAEKANSRARTHEAAWEKKIKGAEEEADMLIKKASANAGQRGDKIVSEAKEKANAIIRQAQSEAELERKKSTDAIKHEIIDVSALLTEKMLGREISEDDHRELIDSFVREIGESDDTDK